MPPKKVEVDPNENKCVKFGRVKNSLKMGVVGLPNVGKSSLFNLLTKQEIADAANYPFCTIDPNEARCTVPDQRFNWLCDVWNPPSKMPAFLQLTDIAGLIRGASEGAGLGNAFLSHIQAVDGIYHLLRVFENDEIVHVDDSVDPIRDLETISYELCQKDISILNAAITKEEAHWKRLQKKMPETFMECMNKIRDMLDKNIPVSTGDFTNAEVELINEKLSLITTKPMIYIVNLSKRDIIRKGNKWLPKIKAWVEEHGGGTVVPFSIEFEQELFDLREDQEAQKLFLEEECKGAKSALPRIIKLGYKQLNLIYFFTMGEKEVRAWTVLGGSNAKKAAGVIHTDFEQKFVKAEVVSYDDYKELCGGEKSVAKVKEAGKYRLEGKSYIVQDGDIIVFKVGK